MTENSSSLLLMRASRTVGFSSLAWNAGAQHYHLPADTDSARGHVPGRWLDDNAVREVIEDDIALQSSRMKASGDRLQSAARALQAGDISDAEFESAVGTWRDEMYQSTKNAHLNYAAAARGGFHNMTSEHYGRVGGLLRFHIEKLDNFAQEILADPGIVTGEASGKMDFHQRSSMYATTALYTYERERVASNVAAGYDLYENVPHSLESCNTHGAKVGCSEITAKGAHKIGTSPDIGKRACGPADLCTWEFSKSSGITQQQVMSALSGGAARVEGRALLKAA
jgi:hypothetical protein